MVDASHIGQSFPPYTIEVERGKVRELALAIGDENPIYQSRQAAQAAGYADVPLYPTSPTIFAFWGVDYPQLLEHWTSLGIDAKRVLHGAEAFEYLCAGYFGYPLPKMRVIDISTRTYSCHLHINQVARKFLRRCFFPGFRTDIQSSQHRGGCGRSMVSLRSTG